MCYSFSAWNRKTFGISIKLKVLHLNMYSYANEWRGVDGTKVSGLWSLTQKKRCSPSLTAITTPLFSRLWAPVGRAQSDSLLHLQLAQGLAQIGCPSHAKGGRHLSETADYCLVEMWAQQQQTFSFKRWHKSSFVGNCLIFFKYWLKSKQKQK